LVLVAPCHNITSYNADYGGQRCDFDNLCLLSYNFDQSIGGKDSLRWCGSSFLFDNRDLGGNYDLFRKEDFKKSTGRLACVFNMFSLALARVRVFIYPNGGQMKRNANLSGGILVTRNGNGLSGNFKGNGRISGFNLMGGTGHGLGMVTGWLFA